MCRRRYGRVHRPYSPPSDIRCPRSRGRSVRAAPEPGNAGAADSIQNALDTTQTNVTWVLTAYLLSASIFTPIMGRLRDLMGKKRMFVFALTALALPRSRRGSGGDRLQRRGRDRHPLSAVPTKNALIAELVRDLLKDVVAPAHQAQQAPDG